MLHPEWDANVVVASRGGWAARANEIGGGIAGAIRLRSDASGRFYFLWDSDLTLPEFLALLRGADAEERRYWLAHLLRQAKPDDARQFVDLATIAAEWESIAPGVGTQRPFWSWRVRRYRERGE